MSHPKMYYEDIRVGQEFTSPERKITGDDIRQFGELTGDCNRHHMDDEFCKSMPYGKRIAHGLLGLSLIEGLKAQTGWFEETAVATLAWKVDFTAPIYIDDTLTVHWHVARKRPTRKPGRGILYEHIELRNQDGVVVQKARHTVMVLRRP
jgi:acyl dehydratase